MTRRGQEVLARLTPRERDIIPLVAAGLSNRQIAKQISVCEQAVKNYMHLIFEKADVDNRVSLIVFCFYHGIVQCPCGARAEKMAVA